MSLTGITTTARALGFLERLQEVTANNLANVSTHGFKLDRLTARLDGPRGTPVPVQVTDLRQGALRTTGAPLDVALDGPGFLVVRTPQGERLSRGGSLKLDQAGQLVEHDGSPVLGSRGPIVAPSGQLELHTDGTVLLEGQVVDRLRVETVADPATLAKEGAGRFVPATPLVAAEATVVRQGTLEETTADTVSGMIDLVTIQRAYAANIDALKAMDGVLATLTDEIGRV